MISSTSFRKSILLSFLLLFISICTVYASTQNQSTASLGGTSSSVGTDSNTGAANVSVPVEVPPGRNGMAPNLALSYNSNKKNGWVGVGWDIKTSFIQRNTKWGLDYSNNDYVADGNRELTTREDWGADYYGHKTEGAFIKYFYNSSTGGWEATTKDGTKHYYGTTAASRQDDPSDATHVFKWMIDRVEDTNGNYITYTYTKDQGEIYLDRIDYTGGSNLSPTNYIKFYYDDSRTDAYAKYIPHFSVTTATRLITIEVVSNNSTVRVYKLEYDADPQTPGSQYSGSTGRSILYSVQQYGSDASVDNNSGTVTGGTALPATTFLWEEGENGFGDTTLWLNHSRTEQNYPLWREGSNFSTLIDINGDGRPDRVHHHNFDTGQPGLWVEINNGNGFDTMTLWLSHSRTEQNYPLWSAGNNNYSTFIDINGDGKPDRVHHHNFDTGQPGLWVEINNGNGFDAMTLWLSHSRAEQNYPQWDGYSAFIDINGDGKPDRVHHHNFDTGQPGLWVEINNGNGFGAMTLWVNHSRSEQNYPQWSVESNYSVFIDINGDGKPDRVHHHNFDTGQPGLWVEINNGNGFDAMTLWLSHSRAEQNYPQWSVESSYSVFIDINGDGKPDRVHHHNFNTGQPGLWVEINNGNGFNTMTLWLSHSRAEQNYPQWSGQSNYSTSIDVNGDGKLDRVHHHNFDTGQPGLWVEINNGNGFDAMTLWLSHSRTEQNYPQWSAQSNYSTSIDINGDGKLDRVHHHNFDTGQPGLWVEINMTVPDLLIFVNNGVGSTTSITYEPSSTYDNNVLPYIIQTVSSISVDDGNGNTSTTNYTYSGGHHDIADREFRGFEYVKSTDPAGTTSETWFKQDDIFKGLPYKTEIKDSSGNLYSKSEKTYGSTSPFTGVDFPYLSQSDDYVFDGDNNENTARITTTTFDYDAYGNITEKHLDKDSITGDERVEYTDYNYDTANWIVSLPNHTYVNNDIGTTVSEAWFTYDTGNLLTHTRWNDNGTNPVITYTYNSYGNQTSITDPMSNLTSITYDSTYTYPYQATNPLSHTATTVYDPKYGKVISETEPNGNTTTYAYDIFGRRTKVIGPLDSTSTYGTVSYEYQDCGTANLRIVTNSTEESGTANYLKSEVCLDGLERTIKTWKEGPDGSTIVQDIEYDSTGRVYRKSLPYFDGTGSPKWITYTYDPVGRVTQITNPDSTVVTTSYDKSTTTFIDANGHKKVEVKDVYGRLIKVEEYTGTTGSHALYATTTYEYNARGNLIKLTDTESNQTTMTYDTLGRKLTMNDPDMGSWSYSYDNNGNLLSQTDAKNQTINFTYDELNRTTRKIYPVGSDTIYAYDETFSTNPTGRLTTLTDSTGSTKYYYDELGRTVKAIKTVDTTSYTTETTYDALSRTTSITYPDSKRVNYTYDTGGNLLTIVDDVSSGSTTYASYTSYNALGQIEGVTYGNGVDTAYTYNPNNSLLSTIDTDTSTGTTLIDHSYTFDNIGSILNITDNIDGTNTQTFTYDALDRLITANSGNYGSLTYAYDTIGNFTSKRGITYTYGAKPHAVTATSNGKTYTYDSNGNMTADTNRTITYNYDNKPSSVTKAGQTAIFYYDGSGSRVKKLTGSSTTIYIGKLYEETGGNITRYIFAGGTRIASKMSTDTYYYHQDHLGSSSVITNSSGVKVEEIRYYPFGETFSDTSPSTTKHKYTSQELDIETGLYYYNARYYDPELGRFISADTIVPDPTNPQSLNRYSYVKNNPLKYTDPSGHGWFKRLRKAVSRVYRSVKKVYSHPVFRIASAVVVGAVTGDVSFAALGGEGLKALAGAVLAGGSAGALTYASSGYDDSGGGSRSSGDTGRHGNTFADGGIYVPRKEGVPDPDPSDLLNPLWVGAKLTTIGIKRLIGLFKGWKMSNLLGSSTQFGTKISKQLSKRGWTKDLVVDAIDNPARTVKWKDTRYLPGRNKLNDSATAFYSKEGGYVVRNDHTGDIVQVSDRLDNNWLAPWD